MDPNKRIIVALDVPTVGEALKLAGLLGTHVGGSKVGLELINTILYELLFHGALIDFPKLGAALPMGCDKRINYDALHEIRKPQGLFQILKGECFWDGKFKDIPNTVAAVSRVVTKIGVKMFNVHVLGGPAMMKAAVEAAKSEAEIQKCPRPLVLGVTILTSLKSEDLIQIGFPFKVIKCTSDGEIDLAECDVKAIVCNLAKLAKISGLDGVVCSPQEIELVREACGPDFLIVTPGIRSADDPPDDQGRTLPAGEAIRRGADYLVIGRPITKAADPVEAAKRIADEINTAMEGGK